MKPTHGGFESGDSQKSRNFGAEEAPEWRSEPGLGMLAGVLGSLGRIWVWFFEASLVIRPSLLASATEPGDSASASTRSCLELVKLRSGRLGSESPMARKVTLKQMGGLSSL